MKKKLLLCLLFIIGLFIITGCINSNEIVAGSYKAFNLVQDGLEYDEEMMKEEGWFITLGVRDDKTATFIWKNTKTNNDTIINFTIKNKKMYDDETGDEYAYSYHNGVVTLEAKDETFWSFK